MRASMADNKDSPVFAAAPMFLRESLMMPYTFGLEFVRTVLANKGKDAAYAGMLEHPPIDTRQIMQPETYLMKQDVPPLAIPDLDKLVAPDYERFDFGGMGEFDIYLLAKQYGGDDAQELLSALARRILLRSPRQVGSEGPDRDAVFLAMGFAGGRAGFRQTLCRLCSQALQEGRFCSRQHRRRNGMLLATQSANYI